MWAWLIAIPILLWFGERFWRSEMDLVGFLAGGGLSYLLTVGFLQAIF